MIMTLMMMSPNVSVPPQACHSRNSSKAELLRALEILATDRVLGRVRTPLPCGQAAYEALLSRQLKRAGTKAAVEALSELQDPSMLKLARFEYRHIFGAIVAKIDFLGRKEFSRDWLLRVWPPMREEDTDRVLTLVAEVHDFLDQLPRDALQHLRPIMATRPGRGSFRREFRRGIVLEAERMRWYDPGIDRQTLASHVSRVLPKHGRSQRRSPAAFESLVRRTFSRAGIVGVRPSQRRLAQGLSANRWASSAVGRWFAPFLPKSLEDTGGHLAAVKAQLDATPGIRVRANLALSDHDSAMTHYLPDDVWHRVAPILASLPKAAARRSYARLAVLGIAVFLAADHGWGNLPTWVGVSAATVRRLVARLRKSGLWQAVKECLVAGPHGRELRQHKLP
jgi:hypothetical protein